MKNIFTKDRVISGIIGVLAGAIIATSGFLIYLNTSEVTKSHSGKKEIGTSQSEGQNGNNNKDRMAPPDMQQDNGQNSSTNQPPQMPDNSQNGNQTKKPPQNDGGQQDLQSGNQSTSQS